MVNQRNQVKIYPIPRGAVLQEDYCIRIRPLGAEHWQEVRAYRVKVDMHDVRQASMAFLILVEGRGGNYISKNFHCVQSGYQTALPWDPGRF